MNQGAATDRTAADRGLSLYLSPFLFATTGRKGNEMKSIQDLRDLRRAKVEEATAFSDNADNWTADRREASTAKFNALKAEVAAYEQDIERIQATLEMAAKNQAKADGLPTAAADIRVGADREAEKPFANLCEQLRAIRRADVTKGRDVDKRLLALNERSIRAAASGANEGVPSEGGWSVQTDFAGMIFESAATAGQILPRVDSYEVGPGFNAVRWVEIDESEVSSTVFGGVRVYRVAEAGSTTATKPKLRKKEIELLKLFGLAYATDELEQDSTFTSQLYTRAFSLAIQRELEGEIISGDGATQCLGILSGGDLVSVAKETGQPADTVKYENFVRMLNRLHASMRSRAAWYVHPDVEEQMMFMEFPVGTGGVPVFLPAGGASATPFSTLFGLPIVPTDHCSAFGDKGDVVLGDLFQYMLVKKGNVKSDTSIHVNFLTDETAYRFIFRANGQPKRANTISIKNSTKARASFVTLDARA